MDAEHLAAMIDATKRARDSAAAGDKGSALDAAKKAKQSYLELSGDLAAKLRPALRFLRDAEADCNGGSLGHAEANFAQALSLQERAKAAG